ncbi:MAG: DUF1648 domain-containing protein [Coriobacteriaceae bacterium]|jgi:uncharacterized membrane protein|nr:DUF1648 domain-containing protein [Coriobacteriaceae bacterium]
MDTDMNSDLMVVLTGGFIPFIGVLIALTPYLMRKNECFAVTVPKSAAGDPYLRSLKRAYLISMLVVTLAFSVLDISLCATGNAIGAIITMTIATVAICLIGFALMLFFRQKVRLHKQGKGWAAAQQEAIALVGEEDLPKALSLRWSLLYLPLMLLTVGVGYLGYDRMPEVLVTHVGLNGQADGWMDKSPLVVWMPVLIQAFLALCMVFSHWTITHSKRAIDPSAPATSALAYGLFARAQSIFLLAIGLLFCFLMTAMPLSFMGLLSLGQAAGIILMAALITVVGAVAISVVYGQGGSRVFARLKESDALLADDDAFWKLGIFYCNPDDPSLFLLERFGIGWTVNWARPAVWAILVGGLLATVAFVVVMFAIA